MKSINQQFQKESINKEICNSHDKISVKLNTPFEVWFGKSNIFLQQKAEKSWNGEGDNKRTDMWTKSKETQRQSMLVQNKIINQKVQHQRKTDINCTRKTISEKLQGHVLAKRGIKKVDNTANMAACSYKFFFHSGRSGWIRLGYSAEYVEITNIFNYFCGLSVKALVHALMCKDNIYELTNNHW